MAQENKPDESQTPKALTLEDVNTLVNTAIGARLKSFGDSFTKTMSSAMEQQLAAVVDKLKPADPAPDAAGAAKLPPEFEARFKQMDAELKAAKAASDNATKLRMESEAKQAAQERRALLQGSLVESKIRPELMEPALAFLGGRVESDPDGGMRWRDDDGTYAKVDAGVKKFLTTPTGQSFLPAKDIKGGPAIKNGGGGGAGGGPVEYSVGDLGAMLGGRAGE